MIGARGRIVLRVKRLAVTVEALVPDEPAAPPARSRTPRKKGPR